MSTDIKKVAETIANMTLRDAVELAKILEDDYGIKASGATVIQAQTNEDTKNSANEEKSSFSVFLKSTGPSKINVIKAIREVITDLSLTEAKGLTDKAPCVIKENMPKEDANNLKTKLEALGAEVELK